ncbi:S-layer homology domain-containing protein [Paenibacillus alkalitolerans]|uniref:S-layer homology domain-containing protein n=1 Tax=Paenibacillus alkalitolerans TaxID=2799335 RepID=UPI0018F67A77|nr:S-layer homology domain-containing protein [Paenibacillus alkalitolerans]
MHSYQRKAFNVLTAAALGISLVAGPAAPSVLAETPAAEAVSSGVTVTFPDVPAGHWARGHVAKLASGGIVKGYNDGTFAPNKDVTQQEAVVMAVRMMGLEDEALANNREVVLGFDVDPFFRPYVVKALETRMLDLVEETEAAASGDSDSGWGKRPASREWLAKLVVRAIGKGTEAAAAGAPAFADADKISSSASGYVRIAADLGIVTGFKEDNTFRPGVAVTRAQIATFLSRADQYMPEQSGRTAAGVITAVNGGILQLRAADSQTTSFTLHANTLVFKTSGEAAAAADLKANQQIKLVHQNNAAYYIEIVNDAPKLESIEGKVAALSVSEMNITLTSASRSEQYKLSPTVAAVNEQGNGVSLSEITKGSTVRLQRLPGTEEISNLTLLKLAINKIGEGVVQSIDAAKRTITVVPSGGAGETYTVSTDAALQLNGQPIAAGLAGVKDGDTVAYEVIDNEAVSVNIVKQRYVTKTGELSGVTEGNVVVLKNGNDLMAYNLIKNVKVEITGLENAALADLRTGDSIELHINGNNNTVESITVLNRNISKLNQATVINFDATRKFITVLNESSKPQLFEITDRTKIMIDGAPMATQLYSLYLAENRKVNLTVSENQLIRLDVVTYVEGKVTALNTAAKTITVTTADNEKVILPYSSLTGVIIAKKASTSIADISVGTQVRLTMDAMQSAVSQIQVKKSFVYTLTSVDTISRKLNVRDGLNGNLQITLDTNTALLNADGNAMALSELKADEPVVATYTGSTLMTIAAPRTVRGKITSLDTVAGKLTVTDFNNNAREYQLSGANVQSGGTVNGNLTAMKVNDRVQVVVDGTGAPYIWVASAMQRTFSSYDAARNEITFKAATLSEQKTYKIHTFAYIHTADGGVLTLTRLNENDKLTVYLVDGKIFELVK